MDTPNDLLMLTDAVQQTGHSRHFLRWHMPCYAIGRRLYVSQADLPKPAPSALLPAGTEALCAVCAARMGRTTEALRAALIRWLMKRASFELATVAAGLSEAQLLFPLDPRVQPFQDAAAELLLLFGELTRPVLSTEEPPF